MPQTTCAKLSQLLLRRNPEGPADPLHWQVIVAASMVSNRTSEAGRVPQGIRETGLQAPPVVLGEAVASIDQAQ